MLGMACLADKAFRFVDGRIQFVFSVQNPCSKCNHVAGQGTRPREIGEQAPAQFREGRDGHKNQSVLPICPNCTASASQLGTSAKPAKRSAMRSEYRIVIGNG